MTLRQIALAVLTVACTVACTSSSASPDDAPAVDADPAELVLRHEWCGGPGCNSGATVVDFSARTLTIRGCPLGSGKSGDTQTPEDVQVSRAMTDAELGVVREALAGVKFAPADGVTPDGKQYTLVLTKAGKADGYVFPAVHCSPGGTHVIVGGFEALQRALPTQ